MTGMNGTAARRPLGPVRVTFANLLRAELYRLVRLPPFWIGLVAVAGTALAACALNLLVILADDTLATAWAQVVPGNTGPFGLCPLAVGVVMVALIGSEQRAGAVASLAGAGLRRVYPLVAGAVLLPVSAAHILAVEVVVVAFSLVASIPLAPVDPAALALGFAGMTLLTAAIAAIPLAMTIATGMEWLGMVLAVIWGLTLPDAWLDGALALLSEMAPAWGGAWGIMRAGQLTSVAMALKAPLELLADPRCVAHVLLVPIGWIAAAGAFAHASLRRRAL